MTDTNFDDIRPLRDDEINDTLRIIAQDPMMAALLAFTFPELSPEQRLDKLRHVHSIFQFQSAIISNSLQRILDTSSEGLTHTGFDQLSPDTPYLFISNHRDIVLDSAFLNLILLQQNLIMTAIAIGDNLVKTPFLLSLAKANRNFIVHRGLPPRELLFSSQKLSRYIRHLLHDEQRSVWIAQREGRTKDGNDATNPGLLKMLAMAADNTPLQDYLQGLRIVPVAISYENDPTDILKLPELIALAHQKPYTKPPQADLQHILQGITGPKKRIHFHACDPLSISGGAQNNGQLIKSLAAAIDTAIHQHYKLWPVNYAAFDLLHQSSRFTAQYTSETIQFLQQKLDGINAEDPQQASQIILDMYARPLINQYQLT
jgi:1-acyl-sn-glycerol-3-phosphate acyltransferase